MTLASENLEHLRSQIAPQPKNQESDPCGNGKAARPNPNAIEVKLNLLR